MIDESAELGTAFERLRGAYTDLEAAKPTRELGRSAAFVNHEIKNHMMVISGYAALLLRSKNLDEKDRAMADSIAATVAKLHDFSMNVLEFSRCGAAGDEEIELTRLLRRCIDANFTERASDISVDCGAPQNTLLIDGSPEKLERAFVDAFRNSFEAGARSICVKISVFSLTALVVIEDDGVGCGAEALPSLSAAFFTTKRGAGTGLGLCVIRSAVEAHNGCVNIYAKNVLGGGKHGLSMQILLPASKKNPYAATKTEIMLVKDGLPGIPKIMRMLNNLKIVPRVAPRVKDIGGEWQDPTPELTVIAAASKAEALRERIGQTGSGGKTNVLPIEEAEGGVLLIVGNDNDASNRELFTEEYLVNCLRET